MVTPQLSPERPSHLVVDWHVLPPQSDPTVDEGRAPTPFVTHICHPFYLGLHETPFGITPEKLPRPVTRPYRRLSLQVFSFEGSPSCHDLLNYPAHRFLFSLDCPPQDPIISIVSLPRVRMDFLNGFGRMLCSFPRCLLFTRRRALNFFFRICPHYMV